MAINLTTVWRDFALTELPRMHVQIPNLGRKRLFPCAGYRSDRATCSSREYDRNLLPVSAARCQTLRTSKFTRAVQLIAVI